MNINELKQLWFNLDYSNVKESKTITIEMDQYPGRKGYGIVQITSDGPNGFSQSTSLQEFPMEYVSDRIKESKGCQYKDDLSEYELIIK